MLLLYRDKIYGHGGLIDFLSSAGVRRVIIPHTGMSTYAKIYWLVYDALVATRVNTFGRTFCETLAAKIARVYCAESSARFAPADHYRPNPKLLADLG